MVSVVCSVLIDAPLHRVWSAAADLGSHADWMADAESVELTPGAPPGAPTRAPVGVGTRMRVVTKVGPFRTTDLMEVTGWEEGKAIAVRHSGLVTGAGRFQLTPMEGGTRFTWREELTFPALLGGPLSAWLARPVLWWIWRRNLERLRTRLEAG